MVSFDPTVLLNYYRVAQSQTGQTNAAATPSKQTPLPPWDIRIKKPTQQAHDVQARSKDPYFDPNDKTLTAKADAQVNAGSQLEALLKSTLSSTSGAGKTDAALANDNDKLFALYKALNRLEYIAQMANRDGVADSQRPGLDKDLQAGLTQVRDFLKTVDFSNATVMAGTKSSNAQAGISIAYPKTDYIGGALAKSSDVPNALPGVTAADSFTVSFTKGGVKTDVAIDLANVQGPLTIDAINAYVNEQLKAAGSGTRFSRVQTGGDLAAGTATWGIKIQNSPSEKVSLSASAAAPALYIASTAGKTVQDAKLVKLTNLSGAPQSEFSTAISPDSGNSSAKATVVDAEGNVYVTGTTDGNFGSEINQAKQDVFLSKFDSTGNLQWTKLLGAADKADAFGLAVDPLSGGVVVAGSVTGQLSPTAIGGGADSFVAKYDANGNQVWVHQVAPAANDSAHSVSVDSAGNIYVAGQTDKVIGSGQTSAGGTDAYFAKLNASGSVLYQRQFGTAGNDAAMQTVVANDGNLVVASIQNGHAVLTKYDASGAVGTPVWQIDLGDLQGGTIGGIAAANGRIYLTGTSASVALDAGGAATIANPNSGGSDSFVFAATDSGATASADFVSYVGTGAADKGAGIAAANGKLYLTGTTRGTFAGETRHVEDAQNQFVAQLSVNGTLDWVHQYGGVEGESAGASVSVDAQGSSVLDALKLPRGTIENNQSNLIESQSTARPGDYFTLVIEKGGVKRETKITLSKGETLRSFAVKLNTALFLDGKAKVQGVKGGQGLNIAANPGVTLQLVPGAKDFDALAGLGLQAQTLVNDAKDAKTGKDAKATATQTAQKTIGLSIDAPLNLLNKTSASHARTILMAAQSQIKQLFSTLNSPPQSAQTPPPGSGPQYLQNQIAGYQTALAGLLTSSGTSA